VVEGAGPGELWLRPVETGSVLLERGRKETCGDAVLGQARGEASIEMASRNPVAAEPASENWRDARKIENQSFE